MRMVGAKGVWLWGVTTTKKGCMTGKKPFEMNMLDLNTKTVLVYNCSQRITFQKTRRDAGQGFLPLTGKTSIQKPKIRYSMSSIYTQLWSGVRFDLNWVRSKKKSTDLYYMYSIHSLHIVFTSLWGQCATLFRAGMFTDKITASIFWKCVHKNA